MWRLFHRFIPRLAGLVLATSASLAADEAVPDRLGYEASGGGDITAHSWSVYVAMTSGLFSDVREDGFRLRSTAGYGAYRYVSTRWTGLVNTPVVFNGEQRFGDTLLGYHATLGALTLKGFAGVTQDLQAITPYDIENPVQGTRLSVKLALETWLRLGDWGFVQADASWTRAYSTYASRLRLGWRATPEISTGLELAANANAAYESGRAGLFARYEWERGEVSASGGAAGDRSGLAGGYGTLNLLLRF